MKLGITLFATVLLLLSCNKKKKDNPGPGSPPVLPAPAKKVPDRFICSQQSPPLVRYNKDSGEQEYCNLGTWTPVMPPTKLPRVLKAVAAKSRKKPEKTRRKRHEKLPRDPNAWRCQSSKKFENSYLCQLSRP